MLCLSGMMYVLGGATLNCEIHMNLGNALYSYCIMFSVRSRANEVQCMSDIPIIVSLTVHVCFSLCIYMYHL